MGRIDQPIPALAIPILGFADLEARDGTSTGSAYTETGPQPGASRPDDPATVCVPVVSSRQGRDYELVAVRQGSPRLALDGAVQLAYREPGEDADAWRGWTPPNRLLGWSPLVWDTYAPATARVAVATVPRSQRVVVVHFGSDAAAYSRRWDPSAVEWEDAVSVSTSASTSYAVLVATPAGRLVFVSGNDSWRSDDEGATWERHGVGIHDVPIAVTPTTSTGALGSRDGLLVERTSTGSQWIQRATVDGFASTLRVEAVSELGLQPCAVALPAGGFVVAYLDGDDMKCRRIATASEPLSTATEISIATPGAGKAVASHVLVVDPDGLLWSVASVTDSAPSDHLRVYASTDGGLTWTRLEDRAFQSADTDVALDLRAGTSATGILHLAHVAGSGSYADSLGVARLGGWDNRPTPSTDSSVATRPGSVEEGGAVSAAWVPTSLPSAQGWTAVGAGTVVLGSTGRAQITTSSAQRYFELTDSTVQSVFFAGEVAAVSGGSASDASIAVRLRGGSASGDVWGSEVTLRLVEATGEIVVVDWSGAEAGRLTQAGLWDDPVQIRAYLSYSATTGPVVTVEYRTISSGGQWTPICDDQPVSDNGSPIADGGVLWGHITSGTATSRWQWVHVATHFDPRSSVAAGDRVSRPLSTLPVPVRHGTGPSIAAGPMWLSVAGGAAGLGESWSVAARYDYPIEALDPTLAPSPAQGWRAADADTDVVLSYDLGERAWIGDAVAVLVASADFRLFALDYYDGSAWVEVAGGDLGEGLSGLSYTLTGDTLRPASGTAEAGRYLQEGELVGGHVILGSGVAREIVAQSAGAWGGTASGAQTRLRLALTGGEPSSGTCTLVAPSGVLVYYPTTAQVRRRWRVRVVAQDCPHDGFRAGVLSVCQVHALGSPTDWGWSRERSPQSIVRRSRSGTSRAVRTGRALRTYTAGWATGGVSLQGLAESDPGASYVSISGAHLPLVAAEDVPRKLEGLLEACGSGATPVVWLPRLPVPASGNAVTVTEPGAWLYGRWITSARSDHEVGGERSGVERPATITIEEIG